MLQKKMETQKIETDYQRKLLQSTIESQEKERKRIASELHDGVGAMLSATKLNLGMITNGTIPKEELKEVVCESKDMIDETIDTVRRISKDLLPSSLEQFGLAKALEELTEKLSNQNTHVTFELIESKDHTLDVQRQLLTFRIVQELINNALRHSEASLVKVVVKVDDSFQIVVSDNGEGFDLEATRKDIKKGVGLYNIENRVSLLNGEVKFESKEGKGTTISIIFEF